MSEELILPQSPDGTSPPITRMAADGEWDALGFGYDMTGDYLHVNSIRNKVINMEAFARDHSDRCYYPATSIGTTETYAGANATEFIKELSKNKGFNAGVGSNSDSSLISSTHLSFSGSISKKSEYQSKTEYTSNYSFARGDVVKRIKRLYLDVPNVSMLYPYITPAFH
jgi:hypothetical protein